MIYLDGIAQNRTRILDWGSFVLACASPEGLGRMKQFAKDLDLVKRWESRSFCLWTEIVSSQPGACGGSTAGVFGDVLVERSVSSGDLFEASWPQVWRSLSGAYFTFRCCPEWGLEYMADPWGLSVVYVRRVYSMIVFSNRLDWLTKLDTSSIEIDWHSLWLTLCLGHPINQDTLLLGIRRIGPAEYGIVTWDLTWDSRRYYQLEFHAQQHDDREASEEIVYRFNTAVARSLYGHKKPYLLLLTTGRDSAGTAGALSKFCIPSDIIAATVRDRVDPSRVDETMGSKQIAARLGFQHSMYDPAEDPPADRIHILEQVSVCSGGTGKLSYVQLAGLLRHHPEAGAALMGTGGEMLRGYYYHVLETLPEHERSAIEAVWARPRQSLNFILRMIASSGHTIQKGILSQVEEFARDSIFLEMPNYASPYDQLDWYYLYQRQRMNFNNRHTVLSGVVPVVAPFLDTEMLQLIASSTVEKRASADWSDRLAALGGRASEDSHPSTVLPWLPMPGRRLVRAVWRRVKVSYERWQVAPSRKQFMTIAYPSELQDWIIDNADSLARASEGLLAPDKVARLVRNTLKNGDRRQVAVASQLAIVGCFLRSAGVAH